MFVGNCHAFEQLLSWLHGGNGVCILSGATGVGKTYGVYEAAKAAGREITLFDTSTCLNGKDFKDKFTKATQSDIMAQITDTADSKRLIFIDELDALLTIDRTFLLNLKCLPNNIQVVLAGTLEAIRRVGINAAVSIDLHSPSADALCGMLKEYNKRNNLRISVKDLKQIAATSDGNIAIALRQMSKGKQTKAGGGGWGGGDGGGRSEGDHFGDVGEMYRNARRVAYDVLNIDPWLNVPKYHENVIHELEQRVVGGGRWVGCVYVGIMADLCDWVVMMGWSHEVAVHFIAASCCAHMSLPLKPDALPSTTRFTKMINVMSAHKKGMNSLYANGSAFPWHHVGSMEKSFLSKR